VGLLAASYAFPLRAWLDQRTALAETQAERDALQQQVDALGEAVALWDDPAYVRAQARERLNFVLPGEAGLVVLGTQATAAEPVADEGVVVPAVAAGQPWWTGLVAAFYEVGNARPVDTSPAATGGTPEAAPATPAATPGGTPAATPAP
jgi:hypothetical protein